MELRKMRYKLYALRKRGFFILFVSYILVYLTISQESDIAVDKSHDERYFTVQTEYIRVCSCFCYLIIGLFFDVMT